MTSVFGAIKGFLVSCFAFLFSLGQILAPSISLSKNGEDYYFEDWSVNDEFTEDYCARLDKEKGKDFVVLNITDVQLQFPDAYSDKGEYSEKTIEKLIKDTAPDLITVTGDNAWNITTYLRLVKFIDSFGIPWAPVMGNHDGQGCPSEFWCAYLLANAGNSLFRFGPKGMGYGNYIINIYEDDKIVHTLFMMDSHSSSDDTEDGKINALKKENGEYSYGYDHLWASQIEWYKWAVKGIGKLAGETVESSVFMHIPVHEYWDVQKLYCDVKTVPVDEEKNEYHYYLKDEYKDKYFGENHEELCTPRGNNGFFTVCKELGSTKTIVVGHDHRNSLCAEYEGIWLCYGLKCGSGCYWEKTMSGGTTVTIDSDGGTTVEHHYVEF